MRRDPATYAAAALLAAGLAAPAGAAEGELRDWLAHDWHVIEAVVFLHRAPQTREDVATVEPRRYPLPMTAFDPPPSAWRFPATEAAPIVEEGPFPPAWLWMDDPAGIPVPEPADAVDGPRTGNTLPDPSAPSPADAAPPIPPSPEAIARDAFAAYEQALVRASMQWRDDGLALVPYVRRMRRSDAYEVLHHGRWFQAARAPRHAVPILLQLGPTDRNGVSRIEGALRVSRELYVEVEVELWLHDDPPDAAADAARGGQTYALLSETRRMRTGDVHYLDHPRIGLVLRADRLDVPDALAALVDRIEEGLQ